MKRDMCITGGTVVTPGGSSKADVGVLAGKIAAITSPGQLEARTTIDASNKLVLPGVIDPHVHFHMWERPFKDDCTTETGAAAAGGVTTMGVYILRKEDPEIAGIFERGGGLLYSVPQYQQIFEQYSIVDGYFQVFLGEENPAQMIQDAFNDGIRFFKVAFGRTQYSDATIIKSFKKIKELGLPVRALIHCEDVDICKLGEQEMKKAGRQDPEAFGEARPYYSEVDSMERYIRFAEATGCPLYIVHVTVGDGPEILARARSRGVDVVGETCPQYLTHTSETKGVFIKYPQLARVNPPLRDSKSNERLWKGLQDGIIELVGTDDSPRKLSEKQGTIWDVPPGLGNLSELLLPVLFSEGVSKGRLSLEQLACITSYNPAKILGLFPKKGGILVGSDADLVLVDPQKRVVLSPDMLHSRSDYSIYDGWEFTGWPTCTIRRGEVIVDDGQVVAKPGGGKVLTIGEGGKS
jgi:dihydroorotase (multifunctional complex type)